MLRLPCEAVLGHLPRRRYATGFLARASLAALAFVLSFALRDAHAAWQLDGVPLTPPPSGNINYFFYGLRADGAGGAYATWQSYLYLFPTDDTQISLRAQRVDILGNRPAPWGLSGADIYTFVSGPGTFGVYAAQPVALVPDGAGGVVNALVSQSQSVEPHSNFNLHRVAPNGTVTGFPFFTGDFAGGATLGTAVDGDGAGGVIQIAIGQTFSPPVTPRPPSPLYARRISPAGTILWQVDDIIPAGPAFSGLAALDDGEGGGWFAWIDTREAGDPDVYVQRFDDTGAPAPGFPAGGQLVCGAAGEQFDTSLAPDGAGGVFVIWRDQRAVDQKLYATHVLPNGGFAPGIPLDGRPIPTTGTSDVLINHAYDGAGGLFLVHTGASPVSYLLRLDSAIQPSAGWGAAGVQLHALPPSYGHVGLAADDAGGAYVSFRNGFGNVHPQGLYAQHYAGDGTLAPGWTADGYRLSGTGGQSKIVRSGSGAIVAWDDFRQPAYGIYAQRIVTDGPVAAHMALVGAATGPGRVTLHWFGAGGAGLRFTIERTADAGWERIAEIAADGTGHVRYEDASVAAGLRYGYRLAWNEDGERHTTIASYVDMPAGVASLAIESPWPNPSNRAVALAVSLASAQPARIDVLDLAGRRVASRDLAGLGAGRHVVALREIESLAAGLYLVQLHQAGETRRVRLVRTH